MFACALGGRRRIPVVLWKKGFFLTAHVLFLALYVEHIYVQVAKTVKQQQQDKSYSVLAQAASDKHAKKRLEAKKQKQKKLRG